MVCSSSPALGPSGPAQVLPSVGAPGGQGLAVNTTVDPEGSFGSHQTLSSGKRSLSGMLWAATRGSAERSRIRGRGPRVDDDNPAPGEGTLPWTRQPPSSVRCPLPGEESRGRPSFPAVQLPGRLTLGGRWQNTRGDGKCPRASSGRVAIRRDVSSLARPPYWAEDRITAEPDSLSLCWPNRWRQALT